LRKEGPAYDLPIALGVLLASEQILADVDNAVVIGELSLNGSVRHVSSVLSMAAMAIDHGFAANCHLPYYGVGSHFLRHASQKRRCRG
jgi:magnesium chelatase family protein